MVQLILSKFLSKFKVSVRWDHSSFWFNLMQLIQILSVQLIFWAVYTFGAAWSIRQLIISVAYSLGGSIQSIRSFDEDSRREYSRWMSDINILLIQIVCVCCGGIIWRVYVWGKICTTGIYDNLLGFGLTCILSTAVINSVFSRLSCKYAKSKAHCKINEDQKFDSHGMILCSIFTWIFCWRVCCSITPLLVLCLSLVIMVLKFGVCGLCIGDLFFIFYFFAMNEDWSWRPVYVEVSNVHLEMLVN